MTYKDYNKFEQVANSDSVKMMSHSKENGSYIYAIEFDNGEIATYTTTDFEQVQALNEIEQAQKENRKDNANATIIVCVLSEQEKALQSRFDDLTTKINGLYAQIEKATAEQAQLAQIINASDTDKTASRKAIAKKYILLNVSKPFARDFFKTAGQPLSLSMSETRAFFVDYLTNDKTPKSDKMRKLFDDCYNFMYANCIK